MKYKAIVFDFDDTLIVSQKIKKKTYYDIFDDCDVDGKTVSSVIDEFPELNRYDTIGMIIERSGRTLSNSALSNQYSEILAKRIAKADELEYAGKLLERLVNSGIILYLSSNTPVNILLEIISVRKWNRFFMEIYGYPDNKSDTLRNIIASGEYEPDEYLVVGDGDSDRDSAKNNRTDFFRVTTYSLKPLISFLNIDI